MWARTRIEAGADPSSTRRCRVVPRSAARAAVIAAIGLVRRAVDLRLEPVEDGTYDRRTDCIQLLLGPSYLVKIGISGADDQNDRVDDAREEQRIVGCQNRGRVEEYDAEGL